MIERGGREKRVSVERMVIAWAKPDGDRAAIATTITMKEVEVLLKMMNRDCIFLFFFSFFFFFFFFFFFGRALVWKYNYIIILEMREWMYKASSPSPKKGLWWVLIWVKIRLLSTLFAPPGIGRGRGEGEWETHIHFENFENFSFSSISAWLPRIGMCVFPRLRQPPAFNRSSIPLRPVRLVRLSYRRGCDWKGREMLGRGS